MGFVKVCDGTYLINQNDVIRTNYTNTVHQAIEETMCINYAFKGEYFIIDSPHVSHKDGKLCHKKRKMPMNEEDLEEQKYHESVTPKLREILLKTQPILTNVCDDTYQGVTIADVTQMCGKCSSIFRDLCLRQSYIAVDDIIELKDGVSAHFDLHHVTNRLMTYSGKHPRSVCIAGEYYLLPRECSFLLSDVSKLDPLLNFSTKVGGFDVIMLDPPWKNKSARRGRKYPWLSLGDIGKIPIRKFAKDGCIVLVWVTNKQKIHKFVKEELFPMNEITYITEWHWVKITNTGQPVFSFTSAHKRPYETIIIGCYQRTPPAHGFSSQVLISIPCTIHSHKPPLDDLISGVVTTQNPRCLEFFARNLKPNWTSWGNEVLELQNIKYFECRKSDM